MSGPELKDLTTFNIETDIPSISFMALFLRLTLKYSAVGSKKKIIEDFFNHFILSQMNAIIVNRYFDNKLLINSSYILICEIRTFSRHRFNFTRVMKMKGT